MFNRKKATSGEAAERLARIGFFEGFTPEELQRVAELVDDVAAEPGAVLTEQGRPGTECFVIESGQANVYFGGEHIATLGPGSMVGEMALLEHRPRIATVVAETPMDLLGLDTRSFRALLEEMPKASQRVMSLLNARLQENAARDVDG